MIHGLKNTINCSVVRIQTGVKTGEDRELQHMATNPRERQAPKTEGSVIQWLLDSDPSIRWQVMQDLIGAPAEEVAAERARVATEGAGARLLALQGADGRWGGAAWNRG